MEIANLKRTVWPILLLFFTFFQNVDASKQVRDEQSFLHLLDSAEILKLKGRYDESISLIEDIRVDSYQQNQWLAYARSLIELADVLRFTYYYTEDSATMNRAFSLMEEANKVISTNLDSSHSILGRFYIYKGKLIRDQGYTYGKQFSDTVEIFLKEAQEILEKNPEAYREHAKLQYESGVYYYNVGETKIAENHYNKLLELVEHKFAKMDYFRALYLYQAGWFFDDIADFERALLCTNLASYIYALPQHNDIAKRLASEILIANLHYNINVYSREGIVDALIHYQNALEILQDPEYKDETDELLILTNLGTSLYRNQQYDSSILILKKAIAFNTENDLFKTDLISRALLSLGLVYNEIGKEKLAAEYFDKALQIRLKEFDKKNYRTHVAYREIGESYESTGDYQKALENFQLGLISFFEEFNSEDIYINPVWEVNENIEPLLYILFDKAGALYKNYLNTSNSRDLQAAFELYVWGYELLNELLHSDLMTESFIVLFKNFHEDFQLSIRCAFSAYEEFPDKKFLNASFQFIEQSKYFTLLKASQNMELKQKIGSADSLFVAERELTLQIEKLKHELSKSEGASSIADFELRNKLLSKVIEKTKVWESINLQAEKKHLNVEDISTLNLGKVQNNLAREKEVIIEYHWSDQVISAMVIGKDSVGMLQIPVNNELKAHISTYSASLSSNTSTPDAKSYRDFVLSSNYLYKSLFEPVIEFNSKTIMSNASAVRFTIVSDGDLAYLPFEAFTTSLGDTSTISYWNLQYLCRDYIINYAYSLNILSGNLSEKLNRKNNKILAMSYSSFYGDENADIEKLRFENELPFSGKEIYQIGDIFNHTGFQTFTEATESQFKSMASDFAIIHLAIHGQADNIDKFNSKLLFKTDPASNDDGQLYAYELYNINLSGNQLAVLSACETGLGKQVEGEGLFSIARGFAYAGCPSIVMSLWKVNDKATSMLMKYFYENLAEGDAKDEALQRAKLSFIENSDDFNSHPSNWAAFIALGDNQPVEIKSSNNWIYYTLAILLLTLTLVYFHFRKN